MIYANNISTKANTMWGKNIVFEIFLQNIVCRPVSFLCAIFSNRKVSMRRVAENHTNLSIIFKRRMLKA